MFVSDEARHFKFCVLLDMEEYVSCVIYYFQKGCVRSHVTSLHFRKKNDNISETVQVILS